MSPSRASRPVWLLTWLMCPTVAVLVAHDAVSWALLAAAVYVVVARLLWHVSDDSRPGDTR